MAQVAKAIEAAKAAKKSTEASRYESGGWSQGHPPFFRLSELQCDGRCCAVTGLQRAFHTPRRDRSVFAAEVHAALRLQHGRQKPGHSSGIEVSPRTAGRNKSVPRNAGRSPARRLSQQAASARSARPRNALRLPCPADRDDAPRARKPRPARLEASSSFSS